MQYSFHTRDHSINSEQVESQIEFILLVPKDDLWRPRGRTKAAGSETRNNPERMGDLREKDTARANPSFKLELHRRPSQRRLVKGSWFRFSAPRFSYKLKDTSAQNQRCRSEICLVSSRRREIKRASPDVTVHSRSAVDFRKLSTSPPKLTTKPPRAASS